ncbi:MAG: DUF4212 domain-containing protein [Sphingomonadales bacterium]
MPSGDSKSVDSRQDSAIYHHAGAGNPVGGGQHQREVLKEERVSAYWRDNIRLLLCLLAVWFAVSFGCGILLAEPLNRFSLGGYPLGFWFAQQGSVYVFVILIFVYCGLMKRIERRHGVDDDD